MWGSQQQHRPLKTKQRDTWNRCGNFMMQLLRDSPKWYKAIPFTPDNKNNEMTFKYFQENIQNDTMMNPLLEYLTWLDDTYGKTEWSKWSMVY